MKRLIASVAVASFLSHPAFAGVCDYTPSKQIGSGWTKSIAAGHGGATASNTTGAAVIGGVGALEGGCHLAENKKRVGCWRIELHK